MSLKAYQIRALAEYLSAFKGQRIGKIIQYSKDVFSFRFSHAGRAVIVLDNQNPTLFLGGEEGNRTSLSTPAASLFRKKLSGAEFVGASSLNQDRVLKLDFISVNDIFEPEPLSIVLELIPTKANMALLDASMRILYAFRPNNILDPRPIFHGIQYEPPIKKQDYVDTEEPFDVPAYFASCNGLEDQLQQRRKQSIYQDFFRDLNAHIKSHKRKIAQIEEDVEKGKKHVNDAEYGNYIYTYIEDIPVGAKSFSYYGKEVALDERKSLNENAAEFFRRAKKAKNAIAQGQANLEKAKKELDDLLALKEFASSCDEETLSRLLDEHKGKSKNTPKSLPKKERGPLPFIAKRGGICVYFGKNAKQNDFLSFLYATKPNYLFFHVKDRVGAHVILPLENPSDDAITFACEIALLATGKEDGEVQYTQHKNIRRGGSKGQVILGSYRSALIREIREDSLAAYLQAMEGRHE